MDFLPDQIMIFWREQGYSSYFNYLHWDLKLGAPVSCVLHGNEVEQYLKYWNYHDKDGNSRIRNKELSYFLKEDLFEWNQAGLCGSKASWEEILILYRE
jgi:hypothetical protein